MNFINKKSKIKKILNSRSVKNGIWLYILQFFNTIIPLFTLPYITRILGANQYGVFSSALNIVGYLVVLVNFGFNLSGTRKITVSKSHDERQKIFSNIFSTKLILMLFSFLILFLAIIIFDFDITLINTLFIMYSMVIASAFLQTWFFQGLQKMKNITILSVISRTISVVLVFFLVRSPSDIYIYSVLYSLTFLLISLISLYIIYRKYGIQIKLARFNNIIIEFKDSWHLFTTAAMSKLLIGIGITVLTFTTSSFNVGIYAAIQKIPFIITMIYAPFSQALYPYISSQFETSFRNGLIKINKICKIIIPLSMFITIVFIIFGNFFVTILYGREYALYSYLLIPLLFWMFFSIMNNIFGVQILVASGHKVEYSKAFTVGVISLLILNITFGIFIGMIGVSIAGALAEIILFLSIIYYILKIKKQKGE